MPNTAMKLAAVAVALSTHPAMAGNDRPQPPRERDCKPYNSLDGYYGNPWCEGWNNEGGGYTITFDRAPDGRVRMQRGYERPRSGDSLAR